MSDDSGHSDATRHVWAILRNDDRVLAVSDAEIVLLRLSPGPAPDWLPEAAALLPGGADRPTINEVAAAGQVLTRIPRETLQFVDVSGSMLMVQGNTDIPFILAPGEMAVAAAVAERISGKRPDVFHADAAKSIWKWNVGMLVFGAAPLVVPLFEIGWGVALLAAAVIGFAARRPLCYLVYAVLMFGGAASLTTSHVLHGPGAWIPAVVVQVFLGIVLLVRYRRFRHLRTEADPESERTPGWVGPAAMAAVLTAGLLSAVAAHAPALAAKVVTHEHNVDALAGSARRLPGHVALLALGLGIAGVRSARGRRWAGPAIGLAALLIALLIATNLREGPEKRYRRPIQEVSTEEAPFR